ncbi:MAG: MarR family transcriptional regulator [Myxococcaceae bacterium]|nr:MarR family transcriptional regulator [Myxococcaceae bacterium]
MLEIGTESSAWQDDVQRFDAAAAEKLGVNTTDLRCASLLMHRALTAKELAQAAGLTPGATTTVLDRLEASKLARRRYDESDRRRVLMELTPAGKKRIDEIWGPLVRDGAAMMQRYSTRELELVRDFVKKVRAIQAQHIARIEGE